MAISARTFSVLFISETVNNQCYNPYIFGKIFSSSAIWSKENGRIFKFIADNSSLKKKSVINFKILVCFFSFISKSVDKSMLQPIHFRKDLFELYNMVERKRKKSKIYSRKFQFEVFFSNWNSLL